MVRLVISDNEGSTTVVPLLRDEITIGRKEGNTIRLTERNISRQHAHLVRVNGVYKLRDLDSYNGVTINGRRVQGESDVATGDQIQIGDYTILVEEEAAKVVAADEPTTISKRPVTPARLVMMSDPSPGAEFALPSDRGARLGRSEDIDCPVNHRSVSREHAEVKPDNSGAYVIRDLESANGLAVNGEAQREHVLQSGDIVELGQVVFRFVAPGEHYFFDAADAAKYRRKFGGVDRGNLKLAGIVLGAACLIAVVVVMSGGSDAPANETVTPIAAASGSTVPTPTTLADDGYDKALSACRAAASGGRFAEALAHAALALKVRPDSADANACKATAQTQYEEEQAYVRGKAALQVGDADAAYQEFSRLSEQSAFRTRPEVATAAEEVGRARATKARNLLPGSRNEAMRLAQSVIAMRDVSAEIIDAAQQVLADARKEPGEEVAVAPRAPTARPSARPAAASPRESTPKAAAAPMPSGQTPMDVASACLGRGDNDCVIRALAGRANSAQELGLLIETYRATGDTKQAQKNMDLYVKRFPTARRADAYRRMLQLQGQ